MNTNVAKLISIIFLCIGLSSLTVAAEDAAKPSEVKYHSLKPSFVANFAGGSSKKLKFVKADISVRVSSTDGVSEVMAHDALVRHQIVMLLSRQTEERMSSSSGQEAIRLEALKVVQEALKEETGSPQIEDLLFTSFVIQR